MTWQHELDELRARERMAREMGGADKVQRQHDGGRLTVRERIDRLIDRGSFHEVGAIAGKAEYDAAGALKTLTPANCVMGRARINGQPVIVLGDDFTVRGGSADATIPMKPILAERMAQELRLPIIRIIEGSGGGGSVKTIETTGRANLPGQLGISQYAYQFLADNLATVPVVALGLGSVAGLGAARLAASHYSIMTKSTSAMFVAGPPVVARVGQQLTKQELGGWQIQCRAGAVDHAVETEEEAFDCARRFLSYLPSSIYSVSPRGERSDPADRREEALFSIIPRDRRQGLQDAADHRRRRRQGLLLRDGAAVRAPDHHRPGAARWAARGNPCQRSLSLRRRLDGGCLRQDRALRRHGRDVSFAGGLPVRLSGLPDRAGGRKAGDHQARRARHGRHQPVARAVVHGHRAQFVRGGGCRPTCNHTGSPSATLAVGMMGLAPARGRHRGCLSGGDRRVRPTPKQSSPRSRRGSTLCARHSARPRRFWVEEIIDPRDTRKLLCEFADLAEPLRTPGPRAFPMRP